MELSGTKIIILCDGRGKRFCNITKKIPKLLVKVGGLTIIGHKLNFYKKQGLANLQKKYWCESLTMLIFLSNFFEKNFTDSAPIEPPEPVIIAINIFLI